MTAPQPTSDPSRAGGSSLPPAAEAVVRRRRVETRQRRLTWWGAGMTVLFLGLLGGLVVVGYQASLRIGGGTEQRVTDASAPGYVATPRPSVTDLYVVTDPDGNFASALLVVPDESGQGGTVVPMSPSFILPEQQGAPPVSLKDVFAAGGVDALRQQLGIALGVRIDSAETVPAEAVSSLAGTEPVEITGVDNLTSVDEDGNEELRYPSGTLSLAPDEVATFLAFEGKDDPVPNQVLRAQAVWEELLARAAAAPVGDLPAGEQAEGSEGPVFSEAIGSLAGGDVRFDAVPMAKVPVPGTYFVAWMPDGENLDDFVARVVPLPTSPVPGQRTPVAVMNGSSDPGATAAAVPAVVRSGGEVVLVGNADSFDVAVTTVEYADDASAGTAERIATELGVTAIPAEGSIEGASVRVVLGADQAP
jgi:hypothetical protein